MANMIRCPAGQHVYDADRYVVCPYCGTQRVGSSPAAAAAAVPAGGTGAPPPKGGTVEWQPPGENRGGGEKPRQAAAPAGGAKTIYQGASKKGVRLVYAWLVVAEGPGRGSSFPLFAGSNAIGRDDGQDVRLSFKGEEDSQISRVGHSLVLVDPKSLTVAIQHRDGKNLTYVNGEAMFEPSRKLQAYDKITLGATTLIFVPFCGEAFRWPAEEEG